MLLLQLWGTLHYCHFYSWEVLYTIVTFTVERYCTLLLLLQWRGYCNFMLYIKFTFTIQRYSRRTKCILCIYKANSFTSFKVNHWMITLKSSSNSRVSGSHFSWTSLTPGKLVKKLIKSSNFCLIFSNLDKTGSTFLVISNYQND